MWKDSNVLRRLSYVVMYSGIGYKTKIALDVFSLLPVICCYVVELAKGWWYLQICNFWPSDTESFGLSH